MNKLAHKKKIKFGLIKIMKAFSLLSFFFLRFIFSDLLVHSFTYHERKSTIENNRNKQCSSIGQNHILCISGSIQCMRRQHWAHDFF